MRSNSSLKFHKQLKGKIEINNKIKIKNSQDLSLVYTPGVAEVSSFIYKNKDKVKDYTIKKNTVAVVSDGSAVLGLGNIGSFAALPVMEGKSALFKHFAGINAFPIVLDTQNIEEIIKTIKYISPVFGGINLEDISAPRCFIIEERLRKELEIPVVHDDQWGAAVVVLAGLINSLLVVNKKRNEIKVVINGIGAAGWGIVHLLNFYGVKNILVLDSQGIIYKGRKGLNLYKNKIAEMTNKKRIKGDLKKAVKNSDVFIGVSTGKVLSKKMIMTMNNKPIVFAMANPVPEIMPEEAKKGGAFIIGTGRSDYPNQINNALVFPGLFKGALEKGVKKMSFNTFVKAAVNLASLVKRPIPEKIIPSIFNKKVVSVVADAV